MPLRRPLLALSTLAALLPIGCGGEAEGYRFEVHPAAGSVVAAGKGVPRAFVRFHPADPAKVQLPEGREGPPLMLTAETDADGKFSLSSYLADDGVPAGDYAVTVIPGTPEVSSEDVDSTEKPAPRTGPAIPKAYRDAATTPLKATVKPGPNRFEFELK